MLKRLLTFWKSSPKPANEPRLIGYKFKNTRTLTNEELTFMIRGLVHRNALCTIQFYGEIPASLKDQFEEHKV